MARDAIPRPDRNPLYAAADPPASGRCPTARGPSVRPRATLHAALRTPSKNWDLHFLRAHAPVRAAVPECLAVDSDDARGAIAAEHRQDLANSVSGDIRIAAAEQASRDRFLSIQEEKRVGIAALEMLPDPIRLIRVKKRKTRLAGDRIP